MPEKNQSWKNSSPLMFCATIVAAGFIIAALIFAKAIADHPIQGNFSGSISSGSYTYPDLMEIDTLRHYMGIYPTVDMEENSDESYGEIDNRLRSDLQNSILNGDWPGFPYVQLNDRLYFSKQAVDDWFAEQAKQQLHIQ